MSRSKAREHALKVLYAKEINPNTAEISADISDALSEKGKSFSDFLVEQVQLHRLLNLRKFMAVKIPIVLSMEF